MVGAVFGDSYTLPECFRDSGYWSRPKTPVRGDEKREMTFSSVGRALSMWGDTEGPFCTLFSVLIEGTIRTAMHTYGSVDSPSARSNLLRSAMAGFFDAIRLPPLPGRWEEAVKGLVNGYSHASQLRNDIAHGIVANLSTGFYLVTPVYSRKWSGVPLIVDSISVASGDYADSAGDAGSKRVLESSSFAYSSLEITGITEKFRSLLGETIKCSLALREAIKGSKVIG